MFPYNGKKILFPLFKRKNKIFSFTRQVNNITAHEVASFTTVVQPRCAGLCPTYETLRYSECCLDNVDKALLLLGLGSLVFKP